MPADRRAARRRPRSPRPPGKIDGHGGRHRGGRDDRRRAASWSTINLGTANGIAPGNMFTVYKIMYPSVPTPRNVLGELVVVAVRERTATARVIYSRDAIMNGDRVELR